MAGAARRRGLAAGVGLMRVSRESGLIEPNRFCNHVKYMIFLKQGDSNGKNNDHV